MLLLFIGSGCAALIYEIVWFQFLQLVIGSSAISLGVLLATFMGGMCLGSAVFPRIVSARHDPLRVYALIELGIGIFGLAILVAIPWMGDLYAAIAGAGFAGIPVRALLGAVCLLPPTVLMGATLPAIARRVKATPEGVAWLGFFYGGNIAGAVFGCLLAGFFLLRFYDTAVATYVAAGINTSVAVVAFALTLLLEKEGWRVGSREAAANGTSTWSLANESPGMTAPSAPPPVPGREHTALDDPFPVYLAIGMSGACALGAEVIWTRVLSLMLGPTVYTFSIILAVFLFGLGIGSSIGSVLASRSSRPRFALGVSQFLLTAAIAWGAYVITASLPFWPVNPFLAPSPWFNFQLDLVRCMWAMLPATCLWGASFPLALASLAPRQVDTGRLVGGLYAANTVGAIIGALGFSMFIIPAIGTQQSQKTLINLSIVAAVLVLMPFVSGRRRIARAALLAAGAISAFLLTYTLQPVPGGVVAYGRRLPTQKSLPAILYSGEGMNASVAVSEWSGGVRNFHVSGKVEASSDPPDMRLQRMLGHISALFHPRPKSVLVVGFGAGVTAGTFVLHPDVERIVICEIEPLIPQAVSEYFAKENYNVLKDPRVEVVYDDARHYIRTAREKFDVITSDPIHPWVKGAATLYTEEYFKLAKERLSPGGVITQWVPLYESTSDVVKSEVATFIKVFPNGTIWGNDINGEGYDVVLVGQPESAKLDLDAFQARLSRPDHADVVRSLAEVGLGSMMDLLGTYAGHASQLQPWLDGAEINRDRNLRLQYLAGLSLNYYEAGNIYKEILAYRRFSEEFFAGSEQLQQILRSRLVPLSN